MRTNISAAGTGIALRVIILVAGMFAASQEARAQLCYDTQGKPYDCRSRAGWAEPGGGGYGGGGGGGGSGIVCCRGGGGGGGGGGSAGGGGPAKSGLKATRALIESTEIPPKEVGAYGIVAFASMPLAADLERSKEVCEAFKATLISQEEVPHVPLAEQMITFWPVKSKNAPEAKRGECDHLVRNYALRVGLDAINDADKNSEALARRRGPFLIAWSPARSRFDKDTVVLLFDLSIYENEQSFVDIFKEYRQKIVDNPK